MKTAKPSKTPNQWWREECIYIGRVADKKGLVPEMNSDLDTFVRYCTMQMRAAERDGQFDAMTYISHVIDDMTD